MSLSNEEYKKLIFKLLSSRLRLLNEHPFFGLMLMHLDLGIDEECDTAYTNGTRIVFGKKFLVKLESREIDFIMMHEIMHVVLKHCNRGQDYDQFLFNVACDIVVNSNILYANKMDISSITLNDYGESMHITPSGNEGYLYTAEEVYKELINNATKKSSKGQGGAYKIKVKCGKLTINQIDDHSKWEKLSQEEIDSLNKHIKDIYDSIRIKNSSTSCGNMPLGLKRMIEELTNPKVDWRTILQDFLSTDNSDYSFMPPDRRIESDFFLPDLNVPEDKINVKILFNIDTSGSISDRNLTKAFSEIKSAIDIAGGGLEGYIVCSDSDLYDAIPFEEFDDIDFSKVRGGGGTDFNALFKHFDDVIDSIGGEPDYIVILTDGYGKFPKEKSARGIPVLWIINNDKVTPPWGVIARM